jgi:hypothetical protein
LTVVQLTLSALGLFVAACASPVSAVRVDPQTVYHELSRSAVASSEPSWPTRNVLQERGLVEAFQTRPEVAIADLHRAMVAAGSDLDALFALAELSFLHARAAAKREYHLAAAVYAWAFLFPEGSDRAPGRFDPRLRTVSIAGEQIPLEADPTAALALSFTGIPIVELEMFGLLGRISGDLAHRPPLISATPYKPGLIPVVFVHGTESSVLRWAEMYNRLLADAEIRSRFQFWFFQYDSGNPITLSSLQLRRALTTAFARLDPDGKDPALSKMLLIGHSQEGLLVKMQVVSSGDRLWNAASRKPLAELTLTDEDRDLLQHALFVEPVPQVSRAVFICTPHRGSFVAGRTLIADAIRWLLNPPLPVSRLSLDIARNPGAARTPFIPSAVDNMSPRSNFIRALQEIPVASSVAVNSIIAVEGDGPVEQGDDGVVKYTSAHIEPMQSELVVRSPHSAQGNPHTIEQVRRILRLHAGLE